MTERQILEDLDKRIEKVEREKELIKAKIEALDEVKSALEKMLTKPLERLA